MEKYENYYTCEFSKIKYNMCHEIEVKKDCKILDYNNNLLFFEIVDELTFTFFLIYAFNFSYSFLTLFILDQSQTYTRIFNRLQITDCYGHRHNRYSKILVQDRVI